MNKTNKTAKRNEFKGYGVTSFKGRVWNWLFKFSTKLRNISLMGLNKARNKQELIAAETVSHMAPKRYKEVFWKDQIKPVEIKPFEIPEDWNY